MADDIVVDGFVYRRHGEQWLEIDCFYGRGELVNDEAAALLNEIERLRAENDRLHDLIGAPFRCTSTEQYDAAMAALSQETVRWLLAAATTEVTRGR